MKVRIRFTKNECIKYLGHLDIMRAFQKCMNRAGIKMVYSEGFNPHQKISFALPLGVGITSEAEYMDAEIADGQSTDEILRKLQDVSGPGFDVLSVRQLKEGAMKSMTAVRYADFDVFVYDHVFTKDEVDLFLAREEIVSLKKTKKGEKDVNIRPMILSLEAFAQGLHMRLLAGSENNLKPELLLKSLYSMLEIPYDRDKIKIIRKELLAEHFVPLDSLDTIDNPNKTEPE